MQDLIKLWSFGSKSNTIKKHPMAFRQKSSKENDEKQPPPDEEINENNNAENLREHW